MHKVWFGGCCCMLPFIASLTWSPSVLYWQLQVYTFVADERVQASAWPEQAHLQNDIRVQAHTHTHTRAGAHTRQLEEKVTMFAESLATDSNSIYTHAHTHTSASHAWEPKLPSHLNDVPSLNRHFCNAIVAIKNWAAAAHALLNKLKSDIASGCKRHYFIVIRAKVWERERWIFLVKKELPGLSRRSVGHKCTKDTFLSYRIHSNGLACVSLH